MIPHCAVHAPHDDHAVPSATCSPGVRALALPASCRIGRWITRSCSCCLGPIAPRGWWRERLSPLSIHHFPLQFGPNCTTWLVAGEVYPTEVRSFFHGMSAAAGKVGALIAAAAFTNVSRPQLLLVGGAGRSGGWRAGLVAFTIVSLCNPACMLPVRQDSNRVVGRMCRPCAHAPEQPRTSCSWAIYSRCLLLNRPSH